jgi:hypothetical protein
MSRRLCDTNTNTRKIITRCMLGTEELPWRAATMTEHLSAKPSLACRRVPVRLVPCVDAAVLPEIPCRHGTVLTAALAT